VLHATVSACTLECNKDVLEQTLLESGFSSLLCIFTRKIAIFSQCHAKH